MSVWTPNWSNAPGGRVVHSHSHGAHTTVGGPGTVAEQECLMWEPTSNNVATTSTVDVLPHTHILYLPQLWTTIALSKVFVFYGSRRPPYLTTFFAVVANLSKSAQLFIFCVCLALPPDVKLCQIAPHVFCVRHKTRHARCDVALFVVGCHRLV